jgi:protein-tyrosine-phosphatase
VVDNSHPESLVHRLPPRVRQFVSPEQTIGLRVPGHEAVRHVMRMLAGPLVLTSANQPGKREAVTAREVLDFVGNHLSLVVDDGPCRFGQPSSVVRVRGRELDVLREGVVPERTLKRLSTFIILFVCTGNTCRSPMAELLCRKMLARRLNCPIDEIEDHGASVISAGLAATLGGRAAPEAVQTLADLGLDLDAHETQPLTEKAVRHADVIYAMTRSHREAIVAQWPTAAERVEVLAADGSDICDPIGGPVERYRQCATRLQAELKTRLSQLEL